MDAAPHAAALHEPLRMLIASLLKVYRLVNVRELQNTIDAVASLPQTGQIKGPQSCPND